jgi:hypothetical protein
LQEASWEDSLRAFQAIILRSPNSLHQPVSRLRCCSGTAFLPAAAHRPAVHLAGTMAAVIRLAALMSALQAFSRDTPRQWGDTINTVEAMGYPLAGVA